MIKKVFIISFKTCCYYRRTKKSADISKKVYLWTWRQNTMFSRRQPRAVVSVDRLGQWISHTRSCSCHQWRYGQQKPHVPVYSEQPVRQPLVHFKFYCYRYKNNEFYWHL